MEYDPTTEYIELTKSFTLQTFLSLFTKTEMSLRVYVADFVFDLPECEKNRVFYYQGQHFTILFYLLVSVVLGLAHLDSQFFDRMIRKGFQIHQLIEGRNVYDILFSVPSERRTHTFLEIIQYLLKMVRMPDAFKTSLSHDMISFIEAHQPPVQEEYKILSFLGKGGYGKVYKVERGGQQYALKLIEDERAYADGIPDLAEIDILKKFDHPCLCKALICNFFTSPEGKKVFGYVLPLAQTDLNQLITRSAETLQDKIKWTFQMISGLEFLHYHDFYHCDIKAENTLIINRNAVLSDFGLSNRASVNPGTFCQSLSSPQLFYQKNKDKPDILSSRFGGDEARRIAAQNSTPVENDIYALGITILFMGIGRYTLIDFFEAEFFTNISLYLRALIPDDDFADKFLPILTKLLQPDNARRVQHVGQLLVNPLFSERMDWMSGSVVAVPNLHPVLIDDKFRLGMQILKTKVYPVLYRNMITIIDMYFRVYMQMIGKMPLQLIISTCIFITEKLHRTVLPESFFQGIFGDVTIKEIHKAEAEIVVFLDGNLTRKTAIDFLLKRDEHYAISYIFDHLEQYEQFSPENLSKEIEKTKYQALLNEQALY